MRLIGAMSDLPAPDKSEVNSSFHTREIKDYYVPNEQNVVLRYDCVKYLFVVINLYTLFHVAKMLKKLYFFFYKSIDLACLYMYI